MLRRCTTSKDYSRFKQQLNTTDLQHVVQWAAAGGYRGDIQILAAFMSKYGIAI